MLVSISKNHIVTFDFLVVDEPLLARYVMNSLDVSLQTARIPYVVFDRVILSKVTKILNSRFALEYRYVQLMKSVESVAQSRRSKGTLKYALHVNLIWVNAVVVLLIFGVEARETARYFQRRIVGRRKEEVLH